MASITKAELTISHDHRKRTATPVVKCTINFNDLEVCMMKTCPKTRLFKLKCQLWGSDPGADQFLYTYDRVYYFPDPTPTSNENREFTAVVGEGLLDEDWFGGDEVYGKVILYNLFAVTTKKRNTNIVHHHF